MDSEIKSPRQERMEAEQNARAQRLARFNTETVPELCRQLTAKDAGSQWQVRERDDCGAPYSSWVRIGNGLTGERIRLTLDPYDNRITAWGSYGETLNGQQWIPSYNLSRDADDPKPTMSADKAPAQLAADLCRRLLPRYREYLAKYREQLAAATAHRMGTHDLARELIAASGGRLRQWGNAWEAKDPRTLSAHIPYQTYDGIDGEVEVSGSDGATFKLRLDVERARQLVAWLAQQPARAAAADGEDGE